MPPLLTGIRYSMRSLSRTPGLTAALLATLAIGVGTSVAVKGFVGGFVALPAPLAGVDRIVSIYISDTQGEAGPVSLHDYVAIRKRSDLFDWAGAARLLQGEVSIGGTRSVLSIAVVTPELARLFSLPSIEGAAMSQRAWQNASESGSSIRNAPVAAAGIRTRLSGTAPDWLEGIYFQRAVDLWVPLRAEEQPGQDSESRSWWILARLQPGTDLDEAQRALGNRFRILRYTGLTPDTVQSFSRVRSLLDLGSWCVFLVGCANVVIFLLGRASVRSRETSLRVALGAARGQIIRDALLDSIVISIGGGVCGVLLALWTARLLPAFLFDEDVERLAFAADIGNIATTAVLCIALTMVCGLAPVLSSPHNRPAAVLRREAAGPSKLIRRLRSGLVIAQMTICCALVISAILLIESFRRELQQGFSRRLGQAVLATAHANPDSGLRYFEAVAQAARSLPGITNTIWAARAPGGQPLWRTFRLEPVQVSTREISMDTAAYSPALISKLALPPKAGRMFGGEDSDCRRAIVNEEAARLLFGDDSPGRVIIDSGGLPVEIVGVVGMRDSGARHRQRSPQIFIYENRDGPRERTFLAPAATKLASAELDTNVVSTNYFDAMGMRLAEGRAFGNARLGECRVAVVNREAADLYFAGKAVGAALIDESGRRTTIIGVVSSPPFGTFQRRAGPELYFPMAQNHLPSMTLILGARSANEQVLADVRRTIESAPGRSPTPIVVKTLESHLAQIGLAPLRIARAIVGACAIASLALCVLGLYGALSDLARQRRRDSAIRIALGARRRHIVWHVMAEGGRLALAGAAAGLIGSVLLSRLLPEFAPAGSGVELRIWLAAPSALAVAVVIASLAPARRALMADPLSIMRDDT